MRTDGAKRHMARLPLTLNRPSKRFSLLNQLTKDAFHIFPSASIRTHQIQANKEKTKANENAPPPHTHLSHASVGVPHLDHHGERRGCHLQAKTRSR